MRLSTTLEVAGFGCLTAAAFQWCLIAGLAAAGVSLLLIGYGTDDEAVGGALKGVVHNVTAWRTTRRAAHIARREARAQKVSSK